MFLKNLIYGRPALLARPKSDTQNKSEVKLVNQSKTSVGVRKQIIWDSESDEIRSKADKNAEAVDAQCKELDNKIMEANQAQPPANNLMQELITLRHDKMLSWRLNRLFGHRPLRST